MFKKKKEMTGILYSPLCGRIIPQNEVSDPVFSEEMLGKGFAVIPKEKMQTLRMPASGRIVSVSDTCHAVNILTDDGLELLIHVGIDTVELRGNGFELLCSVGDKLLCGDSVMNVDFEQIRSCGKETVTPVVITNPEIICQISAVVGECNKNGCEALRYVRKEDLQK